MSLETGTVTFRMFYVRGGGAVGAIDGIANLLRAALPDLSGVAGEKAEGWCGPRHLMDGDLTLDNIASGHWLRLNYVRMLRKVPDTLLTAECRNAEQTELKARGCEFLPRAVRAEIKRELRERLVARAQPNLDGIGVWIDCGRGIVLAEATTDGKIDAFSPAFKAAFGALPIACTPETAALVLSQVNANDIGPERFTPDASKTPPHDISLGMEFLTWLFWRYDATGGEFTTRLHGPLLGYMLEGPLTFWREGEGAHEVTIRKGTPLNSCEAMACLLGGKLLRRAKFVMASGDRVYSASVDDGFLFGSLKLPLCESNDAEGKFQERALFVTEFLDAWLALYTLFLGERTDAKAWTITVGKVRDWISVRNGKAVR